MAIVEFQPPQKPVYERPQTPTFKGFVSFVQKHRAALGATLYQVRPLAFSDRLVRLSCETPFDYNKLTDKESHQALSKLISKYWGCQVTLEIVRAERHQPQATTPIAGSVPQTLIEAHDRAETEKKEQKLQFAREHPSVKAVQRILGSTYHWRANKRGKT